MRRENSQKPTSGFTLLEMLVVLALVSLISSLLMGALYQIYQLQLRLEDRSSTEERTELGLRWFRGVVNGLQTDRNGQPNAFRGNSNRLSGLTSADLSVDGFGMILPFHLEAVEEPESNGMRLEYVRNGKRIPLLTVASGRIWMDYLDENGFVQSEWPPRADMPQLPALVRLRIDDARGTHLFYAHPWAANRPLPSIQLLFGGAGP